MIDIICIGRNRRDFLKQTLDAIWNGTVNPYRLTFIDDFSDSPDNMPFLISNRSKFHQLILNGGNIGSVPSMNSGICLATILNPFYYEESEDDFLLFIEDDMVLIPGWDNILIKAFNEFEKSKNIAFISGFNAPEHANKTNFFEFEGRNCHINTIIRSSFMFSRKRIWKSIGFVHAKDPAGFIRGKPSHGCGSRRDWWYLEDSPNSIRSQNKKCLIIDGIGKHIGENDSTWRIEIKK